MTLARTQWLRLIPLTLLPILGNSLYASSSLSKRPEHSSRRDAYASAQEATLSAWQAIVSTIQEELRQDIATLSRFKQEYTKISWRDHTQKYKKLKQINALKQSIAKKHSQVAMIMKTIKKINKQSLERDSVAQEQ